ncbi:amino acid ABC transporter permease [Microbacterium jejuense]|uniref:Amino acid ABC transporter permease n=1 Tax=Microbacterium jejuense TaxID=1263637 RepID=A0ABS7HK22_9MICO|nr:amino acid ABC transporter permease [Microbacterium jejuense]MBW9093043.1 amino acid ABC transporter permease [Microbacterium jejuense]
MTTLLTRGPTKPFIPRRQYVFYVLVTIVAVLLLLSLLTNANYQWDVVAQYLFAPSILEGLWVTIWITFVCMAISVVLGLILAFMGLARSAYVRGAAEVYIVFFRGTPLLVQLIFWYNISALYPDFSIGIPFGPQFATLDLNSIITPMIAAIMGLSLNEAAYMSEIFRGGLNGLPKGQIEAADALGLSAGTKVRRVILPQLLPVVIPPTWNQLIGMLKNTALISVIGASELLYSAQAIYARTYQTIPLLIVVSLWYLAVSIALTIIQRMIEKAVKK